MKRGDLQMTSTGTGVRHSEINRHPSNTLHLLQVWAKPYQARLPVKYYGRHFSDEDKLDKLLRVVAPPSDPDVTEEREGSGPVPIHANMRVSASILTSGKSVSHSSEASTKKALIHNIMKSGYRRPNDGAVEKAAKLRISSGQELYELEEGDSLYVDGKLSSDLKIESTGGKSAEFVLFEME